MVDIAALKQANASRWAAMHIKADRLPAFDATARRLCAPDAKARYQGVTNRLVILGYAPVPWFHIAVWSEREYGGPPHWDRQLAQGDPLGDVSHNVPADRGPFHDHPGDTTPGNDAWTRGCLDALIDCAPHAAKWLDWTTGGSLTIDEEMNGLGYAAMGVPSAYVWSGSDQYVSGKYVADHVYRASAVDVQEGCAPLLSRMMAIDSSIQFAKTAATVLPPSIQTSLSLKPAAAAPNAPDVRPLWLRALEDLTKPIGKL